MRLGKFPITAAVLFTALFAACSGGGSDPVASNSISTVVQDVTTDPTGATTVITFASADKIAAATTANFVAEDGQTPTMVVVAGEVVTVVWDAFVSPSNRVRAAGFDDVSTSFVSVTTNDASAPTFDITGGTQTPGLGGDTITVAFSGTYVVPADAEDMDNWTLTVDATSLDLVGSTFDFDDMAQTLTITLGQLANLHADFSLTANGLRGVNDAMVASTAVVGAATGDVVAPTLVSVEQNLAEDEYGRVVDFTFSEAMDPVFAARLSHFSVALPATGTSVEQPSEEVLRLSFSEPIVPGADTVDLSGLVDAHGNAFVDATVAVTQPSPVVNAYAATPEATTVADAGGDTVTVVTTQALDPRTAEDGSNWTLVVDGNPIDLTMQTLTYDLIAKTLTVYLDFDMSNGDAFTVTGVSVLDVDGDTFALASGGNVDGDVVVPTLLSLRQNRDIDPTGVTIDVAFSEDVREAEAETTTNYVVSGAMNLVSATLLSNNDTVRLVYDDVVVPGDVTVAVSNILDLAGNTIVALPAVNVTSTDTTSPIATASDARAIAGADNDTLAVLFDDNMIEAEVEDLANWAVESPIGTSVSTTGATVDYTTNNNVAILTFANGVNFQRGDDFQVAFSNARDIGGNTVSAQVATGTIISESDVPMVHAVYREDSPLNELVVVFTEPCANVDDLYDASTNADGTRYDLRDSMGALRGRPTSATPGADGLFVRLAFGFTVGATDTIDVFGCTDLCGNPLLPAFDVATVAEDTTQPSLATGFSTVTTASGDNNDSIEVVFDRPMNPWNMLNAGRFELTGPSGLVTLTSANFTFDGISTVTIALRAAVNNDLATGGSYTLAVNEVFSSQGIQRTVADSEAGLFATGDVTAPAVAMNGVRLDPSDANSLLVTADESLDATAADTAANYDLNSGTLATSATRIASRVVRVTFPVAPMAGDTLDFTVTDLATNASGTISRVVTTADVAAPLVTSVSGTIVPGYGGDYVDVVFDEPVTTAVLVGSNWALTSNGSPVTLAGTRFTMLGTNNAVRMFLPGGADLDAAGNVTVMVTTATDFSGNSIAVPFSLAGSVAGDSNPPMALQSFVNWRLDPTGTTVDVWFDEDVETAVAGLAGNWTATASSVSAVQMLERDHYRLTLSAALATNGTLSISNLRDPAKNSSGTLVFDPAE